MKEITTIINLLSVIRLEYQEQVLISELNNFFNFDHNIFLVDSSANIDRFINNAETIKYTPQNVYIFKKVGENITGLYSLSNIKSKNAFLIVVPDSSNVESNFNVIRKVQRLQINLKIGVFFSHTISTEDLKKLFEWCWRYRIINIFAATYPKATQASRTEIKLNVFTFNPFGTFDVVNIAGSNAYSSFFLNQNSNFQQHQLRVIWRLQSVKPSDRKLWSEIIRVMNISFSKIFMNTSVSRSESFENSTIDIVAECGGINYQTIAYQIMYPMEMDTVIIVVPEALPYESFSSYLHTVTADSFFGYSLIVIVSTMALLSYFRYMKHKTILFFKSAADVANLLMNDNGAIKYHLLPRIEAFLLVPLTFVGLVIVNGILSNLQSHLTQPFMQPQINKIEDMYKQPLNISISQKSIKTVVVNVLNNLSNVGNWSDKISVMEWQFMEPQITTFNSSISFVTTLAYAKALVRIQKLLNIRGYYITDLHINTRMAAYIVNDAFPFIDRFNEIVNWIRSAGLYEKWRREDFTDQDNYIILRNRRILRNQVEIDTEQFPLPMFLVYGWCASIIVLIVEIIWKKMSAKIIESGTLLRGRS